MNTEITDIDLENKQYRIIVRKSRKARHVRLQYSAEEGLSLIIPDRLKSFNIQNFLDSKKDWIEKYSSRYKKYSERFFYLGKRIHVFEQYDMFTDEFSFNLSNGKLVISCPVNIAIDREALYKKWLREKAEEYIPERVKFLAKKHGFNYSKVKIKDQKTRWGSCTGKKSLSFNYKLMYFNHKVIDYVILHELCHLIHLNHSSSFWELVEEKMPIYKFYRKQLIDPLLLK